NNQMARLAKGRTKPAQFDFHYLRFEGQRYGQAALAQLAKQSGGPDAAWIRTQADKALKELSPWGTHNSSQPLSLRDNLTVWPQGAQLPESFITQNWKVAGGDKTAGDMLPACLTTPGVQCDALVADMDGDGQPEVLLLRGSGYQGPALYGRQAGRWQLLGRLAAPGNACPALIERLKAGRFQLVTPSIKALQVDGQQLQFQSAFDQEDCQLLDASKK
ncbi:MAG: DUF4153 domain-containing protein, partial [Burkholderiaceae bacterium]|nr:DUF4153 domain-containing protein [Burkholderiaceae bacterium]